MPAPSTPKKSSKPKAKASTVAAKATSRARPASTATKTTKSSKAAAKAPAPAKTMAKAAAPAKAVAKPPKSTKASRTTSARPRSPRELVRPLIRVRQMRAFTSKRVTQAELEAIAEVARWTGSSRNEQPCRFIVLRDAKTIQKVAELGLPQTRGLPTANAAVAIVVPDEPEREHSRTFDDGRAAERILIAANLLGLGGGISRVRRDVRDGINKVLKLPPNRSVRTIVAIGHPTDEALAPKSKPGTARLPREEVIYEERWPERPTSG